MKNSDDRNGSLPAGERGVSEVLAVALLIGIVVTGVSVILLAGGDALDRNQKAVEVSQAEHALIQLDTKASRVALGDSPTQQVDLGVQGSDGTLDARSDSGSMRVERINATTGESERITETTLGAVVYEHGETTVAYQGGGVWRSDGNGSVMVSKPEVHYRDGTLSVPIIRTERGSGVYNEVELTRAGPADQRFPDRTEGWTNKVNNSVVVVTVQSDYYRAWGQFFEEETNAIVEYDHGAETVSAEFSAILTAFTPESGVIATSGPGDLELAGNGAYVDSYDSSEGDYEATQTSEGAVEAAGDVVISGDAEIAGDARSGRNVSVKSNQGLIDGDVYYTDEFRNQTNGEVVTGDVVGIDGVRTIEPIDAYVAWNVDDLRERNDNDRTDVIENDELSIDGSSGELGPGKYYLENMDLQDEELVLNTTDGHITIGVRDWVRLQGGDIRVEGDGTVQIYVEGRDEVKVSVTGQGQLDDFDGEANLHVGKASGIHVPNDESDRLMVYGQRDFKATIAGDEGNEKDSVFTGIIYAPAGESGPGYVYAMHADVYGAVVTGSLTLGQDGAIHFDHALHDAELPPTVSRLEYMYVTEHRIDVSNA